MEVPLKYYFENNHKVRMDFDKYTFDEYGVVRNKKGEALRPKKKRSRIPERRGARCLWKTT